MTEQKRRGLGSVSRNREACILGFDQCELSCADKSTLQEDADADLIIIDHAPCEQLSHTGELALLVMGRLRKRERERERRWWEKGER